MLDKVMKSFLWHFMGAAILFLFQYIAAAVLGATEFGKANYLIGYSNIIMLFCYFGVQIYLPKLLSEKENKEKVMGETVCTLTCVFIIVSIIYQVLTYKKVSILDSVIVIFFSYSILILEIISSYYVGTRNQNKGAFIRRFIYSLGTCIIFFIMIISINRKYYIYIIPQIVIVIFISLPYLIRWKRYFRINIGLFKYAWPFYISQIGYGMYLSFSKVLQKEYMDYKSVAILSIALSLGSIANMFGENFSKITMPEFVSEWKKKENGNIKGIYRDATRLNSYLILPIIIALIMNSDVLLKILGRDYEGGRFILVIILFSQTINSFLGPNGAVLSMTGNQNLEIRNGYTKSILGFIVAFILGPRFLWGIAASIALSEIIINLIKMIQIKKIFGFYPFDTETLLFLILQAVFQIICLFFISKVSNLFIKILIVGSMIPIFYFIEFRFSTNSNDIKMISGLIKNRM